jgi:hypothetical protein
LGALFLVLLLDHYLLVQGIVFAPIELQRVTV